MPIQLFMFERRDATDREDFGNAAYAACKAARAQEGVVSSRFFWADADTIVFLTEGSGEALDSQPTVDYMKALYELADKARLTMNQRLLDPRAGVDNYRRAGR